MQKTLMIILDGFGLRDAKNGNAIAKSGIPNIKKFMDKYPWVPISASAEYVGLPSGIMGNSEVGHMNIGAGRIVNQDVVGAHLAGSRVKSYREHIVGLLG